MWRLHCHREMHGRVCLCILEDMDFELRLGHRMWILKVNFVIKFCNESQFLGFLVY